MNRRLVLASFAVLAVAGCSSSSSGGNGAASSPPTLSSDSTSPTASASQTPTASPSPSVTPTFPTTVKATKSCVTANLSLSIGQGQGAAGSTIIPLVFTNTGSRPCTMYGYPGVSFLDSGGQQLGVPAARSGTEEGVVTLAPGTKANALLSVPDPGNFSSGDCNRHTSASVRAYPPDQTASLETAESVPVCTTQAGVSSIGPVTPGSGN